MSVAIPVMLPPDFLDGVGEGRLTYTEGSRYVREAVGHHPEIAASLMQVPPSLPGNGCEPSLKVIKIVHGGRPLGTSHAATLRASNWQLSML